jgi:RNA polymerase sigma factor (sigma-70 family)
MPSDLERKLGIQSTKFFHRCDMYTTGLDLDAVEWLLSQSHAYPLLTAEQEILLSRHVKAWKVVRDKPELTVRDRAAIRRGERAHRSFYLCNIRLVVHIAQKFSRVKGTMGFEDLVQEGLCGLATAIEGFDAERGYKFSTYAYWWIRQAIARAITNQSRVIRIPSGGIDTIRKAMDYIKEHQRVHGRTPPLQEVASACKTNVDYLRSYLEHYQTPISLDSKVRCDAARGSSSTYLDLVADTAIKEDPYTDSIDNVDAMLPVLLERLTDVQRVVLEMRFGLNGHDPHTYTKIAEVLGVTRQRAQQVMQQAEKRLRRQLAAHGAPQDIPALQCAA